jgi:hypothetical protein
VVSAELNGIDGIFHRMTAVQPQQDSIAPGLGAKVEFCIGTVPGNQFERLITDKLRADF